ncbi:hypothetical protein CUMW_172330 [Citrus unshiu]|uniref:Pentacotripeptide-repeat region of PRORP domain-containing protein n=1 Tax=Citrus unshiu TaxID=55188 RepID=A0A2H5PVY3_CITUN|nr:hypothetical protein CUMW_172330 [Citrus unshiu]
MAFPHCSSHTRFAAFSYTSSNMLTDMKRNASGMFLEDSDDSNRDSSEFSSNSFIFTNTNRRNHNKIPQFNKLVVFATRSPSAAESLDLKENPRSLQAQRFVDKIKASPLKERIDIFNSIKKDGTNWSVSDFNDLLMALVMLNEQDTAVKFFSNHLMVGRVEEAYEMLMNVKNDGLKPAVYTYTAIMDGFCKVGRSNEAMELLNEAIERGVTPNVVTLIQLL